MAELQQAVQAAQKQQESETYMAAAMRARVPFISVTSPTSLRAGADNKAEAVLRVNRGKVFQVLSQAGDWYAVGLDTPVNGYRSAWLSAAAGVPTIATLDTAPAPVQPSGAAEKLFEILTERATSFKEKYRNNQYVSVTGFSVNVVPPNIQINFEFKK